MTPKKYTIKPLKWKQDNVGDWSAECQVIGRFYVEQTAWDSIQAFPARAKAKEVSSYREGIEYCDGIRELLLSTALEEVKEQQ